jgi:hypothetical protein
MFAAYLALICSLRRLTRSVQLVRWSVFVVGGDGALIRQHLHTRVFGMAPCFVRTQWLRMMVRVVWLQWCVPWCAWWVLCVFVCFGVCLCICA